MAADDIAQIIVAGQRTGIVGLKKTIEEVARECAGRADAEITAELMVRLSKKNYIVPKVKDAYGTGRKENHHGNQSIGARLRQVPAD